MLKTHLMIVLVGLVFFSSQGWASEAGSPPSDWPMSVFVVLGLGLWVFYRLKVADQTIKYYGFLESRYEKKRGILLSVVETQDNRIVLSYRFAKQSGAHTGCGFSKELLISEVGELNEYVSQDIVDDIRRTVQQYENL